MLINFIIIIPARYESTRFPGKLLKDLLGKTVLQRTWEQCQKSAAKDIYIATDHKKIIAEAERIGAKYCVTSQCLTGTDRIAEACKILQFSEEQLIVNVQGDEPLTRPIDINQLAKFLSEFKHFDLATLSYAIKEKSFLDSNLVKVVTDKYKKALYFSRASIPWQKRSFKSAQGHIGLYTYYVKTLFNYQKLTQSPLEIKESLEQLRFLWNGLSIGVQEIDSAPSIGINVEADYLEVLHKLKKMT